MIHNSYFFIHWQIISEYWFKRSPLQDFFSNVVKLIWMKILLKIFKFNFEFWKGSNKSQWILFPFLNSTSKMPLEFMCQNSGPGGALSISKENSIITFFYLLMSILDRFETYCYQWKACFLSFRMYVSCFVFKAFKVLELLSEKY